MMLGLPESAPNRFTLVVDGVKYGMSFDGDPKLIDWNKIIRETNFKA